MGPYRHISVAHFIKRYIFLKGVFVEAFLTMIMKNKYINFLIKLVETAQHSSILYLVITDGKDLQMDLMRFIVT